MNGLEVQAMWEADAAAEWERLNQPDPFAKVKAESAVEIRKCVADLETAISCLMDAAGAVAGTPVENEVSSYYEELIGVKRSMAQLADEFERG